MDNEDKTLQILAKLLADIGELKETQSEFEKSLIVLEQRMNKLEGKSSLDLEHLPLLQNQQNDSNQQISNTQTKIEKSVDRLLDRKLQNKKRL